MPKTAGFKDLILFNTIHIMTDKDLFSLSFINKVIVAYLLIWSYSLWLNISVFAKSDGSSILEGSNKAFMFMKNWNIPFPKMKKKIRKLSDRIFQLVPFVFIHGFWDVKAFVYCRYYTEVWSLLHKDVPNLSFTLKLIC